MCLSLPTESKIRLCLLLLLSIIEGGGYGFGDNIRDVLLQKFLSGAVLTRLQAVVRKVSNFFGICSTSEFRVVPSVG